MLIKKFSACLLCFVCLFMNIPPGFSYQNHLASNSFFKLCKKHGIELETGWILKGRIEAIRDGIRRGKRSSNDLQEIDERVCSEYRDILKNYPFNYKSAGFLDKDKKFFHIYADIYHKNGEKQLILFYDLEAPPKRLLTRLGVNWEKPDDVEAVQRGYWIASVRSEPGMSGRGFRAVVGTGLIAGSIFIGCLFDTSGIPATKPWDIGVQPDAQIGEVQQPDFDNDKGTDKGVNDEGVDKGVIPDIKPDSSDSSYTVTPQSTPVTPNYLGSVYYPIQSPGVKIPTTSYDTNTKVLRLDYEIMPGSTGSIYTGFEVSTTTEENVALGGTASASSYDDTTLINPLTRYAPDKAIDDVRGIINDCEWAAKETTPWWQVTFISPQDISTVVIYDRANVENIITGVLRFSDGSFINVGAGTTYPIDTAGKASPVTFPEKKGITWVKLESTSTVGPHPGLSEVQVISKKPHSDLVSSKLTTLLLEARGNNPFMIQLTDKYGQKLYIKVSGLDSSKFQYFVVDLNKAKAKNNSKFDLSNLHPSTRPRIFVLDNMVPKGATPFKGRAEIKGVYLSPPPTGFSKICPRGEFCHDPDLTHEESKELEGSIGSAKKKELRSINIGGRVIPIYGITEWPGYLSDDGLNFVVGNKKPTGFTVFDEEGEPVAIYKPDLSLIQGRIDRYSLEQEIAAALKETARRRDESIEGHEIDEASKLGHAEAVLNEFSKSSIGNGLNLADIGIILLRSFTGKVDRYFHERFLTGLFTQGIGLFLSEDIYLQIIKEMIEPGADEGEVRNIYQRFTKEIDGSITQEIAGKELSYYTGVFNVTYETFSEERGFEKLIASSSSEAIQGTILIDLNRFFIKNTSLSSAVTIDVEYLKRFIAFARMLPEGVKFVGLTDRDSNELVIGQLLAVITNGLPVGRFSYRKITFRELAVPEDTNNSIFILTEENLEKIPGETQVGLKIIVPRLGHNRVTDAGYEFYAAREGLGKTREEFRALVYRIAEEYLSYLVKTKKIREAEKIDILESIETTGIGFMPSCIDPIKYNETINSQRALLIAT